MYIYVYYKPLYLRFKYIPTVVYDQNKKNFFLTILQNTDIYYSKLH